MTASGDLINTKKAVNFLRLFRSNGLINLVAIHPVTNKITGITRPIESDDVFDFIEQRNGTHNLYFMVNEPEEGSADSKLKKDAVISAHAVWIDADPRKDKDFNEERIRLKQFADDMAVSDNPPTYIIDSGGGYQMFWVMEEGTPLKEYKQVATWEAYSRGLAIQYHTDSVHNIDRIMRIPFTWNLPTAKKKGRTKALARVVHADTPQGKRYNASDMLTFITPKYAAEKEDKTVDYDFNKIKRPIPDYLQKKFKHSRDNNKKLDDLWHNVNDHKEGDRSRRDFTLTQELRWENYTLEEIATILWNFPYGKNKEQTKREIARNYINTAPALELPKKDIERIAKQKNPIIEAKKTSKAKLNDMSDLIFAGDADWTTSGIPLFKHFLDQETIALTYGPSNSGKSFLMLSMALHLAAGRDWAGYKCKQKMGVLYVSAEAGTAFGKRVYASIDKMGYKDAPPTDLPFAYVPIRVDLLNSRDDLAKIALMVQELERVSGYKCGLVVIDTLAASFGGGNENSSEDTGKYLNNMMDLKHKCKVTVMPIHHSGKDESAGARGHSSLKGNVDTEIRVKSEKKGVKYMRGFVPTKQRDDEVDMYTRFGLNVVELGVDEDGDSVTTCTVVMEGEDEFDDVSVSLLDGLSDDEKAYYKALEFYHVNNVNPDIYKFTEHQIKVLLYWDIKENVGVLVSKVGTNGLSSLDFMEKPNNTKMKSFKRIGDKLGDKGIDLNFELNQEDSESGDK